MNISCVHSWGLCVLTSGTVLWWLQLLLAVLDCGEVTETLSLAVISAQCMNTVGISTATTKEFTHMTNGTLQMTVSDGILCVSVCRCVL